MREDAYFLSPMRPLAQFNRSAVSVKRCLGWKGLNDKVYTEPDYYCLNIVRSSPPRVGVGVPILPTLPRVPILPTLISRSSHPTHTDYCLLNLLNRFRRFCLTRAMSGGRAPAALRDGVAAGSALRVV